MTFNTLWQEYRKNPTDLQRKIVTNAYRPLKGVIGKHMGGHLKTELLHRSVETAIDSFEGNTHDAFLHHLYRTLVPVLQTPNQQPEEGTTVQIAAKSSKVMQQLVIDKYGSLVEEVVRATAYLADEFDCKEDRIQDGVLGLLEAQSKGYGKSPQEFEKDARNCIYQRIKEGIRARCHRLTPRKKGSTIVNLDTQTASFPLEAAL